MHVFLALIMISLCVTVIVLAFVRPHPILAFFATLSIFSLGYYALPMLFVERSPLRNLPENEIVAPIAMSLLYFIGMLAGLCAVIRKSETIKGIHFRKLDNFIEQHWWTTLISSNLIVIFYNSNNLVTFYQAGIETFFDQRSLIDGFLGFFIGLSQAFSAFAFTIAVQRGEKLKIAASGLGIAVQLLIVVTAGQRLVFITPLIFILAAFVAQRRFKLAASSLGVAVLALLIISPFAVALRSGVWNQQQDVIAENFTYGEDPVDTAVQSIVDRADLLYNMVTLKAYIDENGTVGGVYYLSVLVMPVPRFIYPDKPYILSDTGSIDGEASVLAWRLIVGPTVGSLSAFGSIVAYREGGWLWVPVNGFLNGLIISILLTAFYRGGRIANAFFALGFLNWSVRKVPTSFMETMSDVMTYLPMIIALYILNRLLMGQLRVKRAEGSVAHLGS